MLARSCCSRGITRRRIQYNITYQVLTQHYQRIAVSGHIDQNKINAQTTVLSAGLDLREINPLIEARVVRHPRDLTKIAFKNESKAEWHAFTNDGKEITVPSSKSIVIGNGIEVSSEDFSLKVLQEV